MITYSIKSYGSSYRVYEDDLLEGSCRPISTPLSYSQCENFIDCKKKNEAYTLAMRAKLVMVAKAEKREQVRTILVWAFILGWGSFFFNIWLHSKGIYLF